MGSTLVLVQFLGLLYRIYCNPIVTESDDQYVDTNSHCNAPLGIARDSINIQVGFTVTSSEQGEGDTIGIDGHSFRTQALNDRTYIQVEFQRPMYISGIVSQGSDFTDSRVTHFKIAYSLDCITFTFVRGMHGDPMVFAANLEMNTSTTTMFHTIFKARCVRVVPTRRIGDETAMRLELLGCEPDECNTEIQPTQIEQDLPYKRVVLDSEKIITNVVITVDPRAIHGIPAFIVGISRTCHFDETDTHIVRVNGEYKVFSPQPGSNLVYVNETFPVRAQCFLLYSPSPSNLEMANIHPSNEHGHFQSVSNEDYTMKFYGCDAVEKQEPLTTCGKSRLSRSRRQKRVVGGHPSMSGEWPWLVSLNYLGNHSYTQMSGLDHLCGGSLIHPEWVLTAAHCFSEAAGEGLSDKANWKAVIGEHLQGQPDGTEQAKRIDQIIVHPQFVLAPSHFILYDIALVKLSSPVTLSDYANVICIEPNYTFPDGTSCITAGWGNTRVINGHGVELPNHAHIELLAQEDCADRYNQLPPGHEVREYVSIQDSVMCATAEENGTDSCWGDSGGPLVCYHDDHWTQTGIVSFGYSCGDTRYPGIYTRVNYFYDWINDVITNN